MLANAISANAWLLREMRPAPLQARSYFPARKNCSLESSPDACWGNSEGKEMPNRWGLK